MRSTINCMSNQSGEDESTLLQLSSGAVAGPAVAQKLTKALEEWEQIFQEFATKRLKSKAVKFSETLKKRKVLTFGTMGKKKVTKAAGREITFKADQKLFARLILVRNARTIQLDEMLNYNLGRYLLPSHLFKGLL